MPADVVILLITSIAEAGCAFVIAHNLKDDMPVYRIIVEVVLQDDLIEKDDFIYQSISEFMEIGEQIVDYDLSEV